MHPFLYLPDCAIRRGSLDAPHRIAKLLPVLTLLALTLQPHQYILELQGFQVVGLFGGRQLVKLIGPHA